MTAEFLFDGKTYKCTAKERAPDPNQPKTTESCELDSWPRAVSADWRGGKLTGFTLHPDPLPKQIDIRILHDQTPVRSGVFTLQYEYNTPNGPNSWPRCGIASVELRE